MLIVCVWRHLSIGDSIGDQRRPRPHLVVVLKGHRPNAAFLVANHAIIIDDSANFAIVGQLVVGLGGCLSSPREQGKSGNP